MEEIKVTIPSGWNELTVEQLQKIHEIRERNKPSTGATPSHINIQNSLDMVCYICQEEDSYVKEHLTVENYYKLAANLKWIQELPKSDKFDVIRRGYEFEGTTYCFSPLEKITAHEYADIYQYIEQGQVENLHKIISVLFRPIKRDKDGEPIILHVGDDSGVYAPMPYDSDEAEFRANIFKRLPSDVAHKLADFFLFSLKILELGFLTTSKERDQIGETKQRRAEQKT